MAPMDLTLLSLGNIIFSHTFGAPKVACVAIYMIPIVTNNISHQYFPSKGHHTI